MQKIQENVHELIFRISKNGDERAFRMLFDLYFAKLIPFANYHINNTFQSEEIISDVFIKIWRQRSKLGSIKQFDLYLYTAVRNGCYNYLRDNKPEKPCLDNRGVPGADRTGKSRNDLNFP